MCLCIEIIHVCTPKKKSESTFKLKKKKKCENNLIHPSHKHGSRLYKPNSVLLPDARLCKQPLLQFLTLLINVSLGPGLPACAHPVLTHSSCSRGPSPLGHPARKRHRRSFSGTDHSLPPAAARPRSPASGASPSSGSV